MCNGPISSVEFGYSFWVLYGINRELSTVSRPSPCDQELGSFALNLRLIVRLQDTRSPRSIVNVSIEGLKKVLPCHVYEISVGSAQFSSSLLRRSPCAGVNESLFLPTITMKKYDSRSCTEGSRRDKS